MHYPTILAALAAAVPAVNAAQAYIKNYCDFDVTVWPVDILRRSPDPITLKAGSGEYTEQYHTLASGGVSLKMAPAGGSLGQPVTQFEYTLIGGFIWYDGSNVDCQVENCPFYKYGIYLDTSDPSCPTRTCAPGKRCDGFYNLWNDDVNTLACQPGADVRMYLCATSGSGPAAAAAAPAASLPSAVSSVSVAAAPSATIKDHRDTKENAVAIPSASSEPVYRMEALHVKTTFKKLAARATPLAEQHAHMRRHMHQIHKN